MNKKILLTYFALMLGLLITTPAVFGNLTKQIDTFSTSLKTLKLKLVDLAGKMREVKEKLTVPTKSKDEIFEKLYTACLFEDLEALKQMAHLITPEIVNTKKNNVTPLYIMGLMNAKNLNNRIAMINILIDKGAHVDTKNKNNYTLLLSIVTTKTNNLKNRLTIIELLIKKGADVNAKEPVQQNTPLHLACEEPDNNEIIELLIKNKANVDAPNTYRDTPLHLACEKPRNEKNINVLLTHKANPLIKNLLNKTPIDSAKASGNRKYIPLLISDEEIEKALNEACQSGDLGILNDYPDQIYPDIINKKQGPNKTTFLHRAIASKQLNVIKFLIQNKADINAMDTTFSTPLHIACYGDKNEEIIKILILNKALTILIDYLQNTPLDIAKKFGHQEYIPLLISDEEIEKTLNNACMSGDLGTLKEFPNKIKPELINKKLDDSNHTFLHLAIIEIQDSAKRLNVVKFLIQKGASLHAVNTAGSTPLHIACYQKNNEEIIKLLIEEDDKLINEKNDLQQTPLDIAQESGHREYEPLLKKTKKLSDDEIEEALTKACEDGDLGILETYTGQIKKNINKVFNDNLPFLHRAVTANKLTIVKFLLDNDADINMQSSTGSKSTPLHLACRIQGAEDIIKLLVEKGADIHKKNNNGDTPLDIAIKSNIPEHPKLLVKELPDAEIERALNEARLSGDLGTLEAYSHPIDKNIIDNRVNGLTTLHEACTRGFLNVTQFLIKKEADINALDPKKNTPLHLACLKKDNDDVIRFLLENKDIDLSLKNAAGQTPRQIAEKNNIQYIKIFQEFEEQECSICHNKHKPISFYTTPCDHKFCILCIAEKGLLKKFEETNFTCPTCNEELSLDDIEQWYQPKFWKDMSWDDIKTEAKKEIAKKLDPIKDQLQKLYNIKNRSPQKDDELEELNKKFKQEIKVLDKLEICSLCQFDEREKMYTTYCGHKFCYNCIIPSAINSVQRMGTFVCPTCRRGVLKDEVDHMGHPVIEYESINDSKDIPQLKNIWKQEQWKKLAEEELLVKITELTEENFPKDYNGQHYNFGFADNWMNPKRKKHEQALNTLLKDLNPDLCNEKTYETTCGEGHFAPKHVFRYTYFIKLAIRSIQKIGLSPQGDGNFKCPICHRKAETLAATDQQNVVAYKPIENSLKLNELKNIWKQAPWKNVAKEELNKRIAEITQQNFPTDPDEQMDKFGFQGEDVRKERRKLLENLLGDL